MQKTDLGYSIQELSYKYSISPHTIRYWIQTGTLSSKKVGRKHYITDEEFSNFISREQKKGGNNAN